MDRKSKGRESVQNFFQFLFSPVSLVLVRLYTDGTYRHTGVETSVKEVLAIAEKVTGVEPQVIHNPRRVGGAERMCADLTIAGKKLNYAPKVMLEEGMRRTFEADENLRK